MTTEEEIQSLINKFGQRYEKVISDSIKFLNVRESKWNLDEPIDREKYVQRIIEKIKK